MKIRKIILITEIFLLFLISCSAPANEEILALKAGRWSTDCATKNGLTIKKENKVAVEVNSNQVNIEAKIEKSSDKSFDIYLVNPTDLGLGGQRLDWDNFSRKKPIGTIYKKNQREIILNWKGFFVPRQNKYYWNKNPDFYKKSGSSFYYCQD